MSPRTRRILLRAVSLALSLAAVWIVVRSTDVAAVAAVLGRTTRVAVAGAVLV